MDYNNINKCIEEYKKDIGIYNFKTKYANKINILTAYNLECEINRADIIIKLNKLIHDIQISKEIECGIFEYSLIYTKTSALSDELISAIYNDKANDIIMNLDKTTIIQNTYLLDAILTKQIDPYYIAFMSPIELFPARWKYLIEKKEILKYKADNIASTDLYQCRKCGERKCKLYQMQTRSADEPMTTFITCLICGNTFKK